MTILTHNKLVYVYLLGIYFLYSLTFVSSKFAGTHPVHSVEAILFYGIAFLILGIYALLYQKILKDIPLITAYSSRAVVIPLGMVWGYFIFEELITLNMIAGAIIVILGVLIMVRANA